MSLKTSQEALNPYTDVELKVVFERPDGSKVSVDGFYDGGGVFKARAYCDTVGLWRWTSSSNVFDISSVSDMFEVRPSSLPGKLRLHKRDRRQFMYDNGKWFLHIGDTGYRYVTQTEPKWREYIDQAAGMGATKIRTWFCQGRFKGYDFVDADWSDIITLEDMDQVDGRIFKEYYATRAEPMVLDEDRYEHWRNPKHDRYFFRRLMWASLLSGGHATYGGLRTYEPYDGNEAGVQGYFDAVAAGKLEHGADDFVHIHKFFKDAGLTLVGMKPDDAAVGGEPGRFKCIHDDRTYVIYAANPDGPKPSEANFSESTADVVTDLPEGAFTARWFNPGSGEWTEGRPISGGRQKLMAPGNGDWILLLRRNSPVSTGPLRVHPQNPRHFTDDSGRAIFLAGSHTWANFQERGVEGQTPDFDYERHLDWMQELGHNFMRMWRWEHAQWMQFVPSETLIRYEPMAYMRTGPGLALDGKPKFDLCRFNQAYFDRLRERVAAAGERGIYVSVMMFQGFSVEQKGTKGVDPKKGNAWDGHPYNSRNNVNDVNGDLNGDGEGDETHTLKSPEIVKLQETYVRKVIETLNDLDNVLWEISNESHTNSVEWQYHMIRFIKRYEASKPKQHPVGMTSSPIDNPPLFASPADWISPFRRNYLDDPPDKKGSKVIIVDNDHINPWDSDPQWVWRNFFRGNHFILMDSYMDFRIGSPDRPDPKHDPARKAMGYARRLSEHIDLGSMVPHGDLASTGYCLASPGFEYVVYQPPSDVKTLSVRLDTGVYAVEWTDPGSGRVAKADDLRAEAGEITFACSFNGPSILHLKRKR